MRNGRGEADLGAQRRDHEGSRVEHGASAERAPLTLGRRRRSLTKRYPPSYIHVEKFFFCLTGPYLTRRATIGRLEPPWQRAVLTFLESQTSQ